MDDEVAVQVAHCSRNLSEVKRGQTFIAVVPLSDLLKETAVGGQLKEQIDFGGISEEAIHFENIGVVGEHLHLYFLGELAFHAGLPDLLLIDHLDGQDQTCPQVAGHVDVPETAFPQLAAHFELLQAQFFALAGDEHAAEIHQRGFGEFSVVAARLPLLQEQLFIEVMGTPLHEVEGVFLLLGLLDLCLVRSDHVGLVD